MARNELSRAFRRTVWRDSVDKADNGSDAWQMGGVQPYDAVVLDLGLPVLDGLSVLKRWVKSAQRSKRPSIKFVKIPMV